MFVKVSNQEAEFSVENITGIALQNIIDTIGAENIRVLLPMWETGGTKCKDLLKNNVSVTFQTAASLLTFGKGVLGTGIKSATSYWLRDSITESTTGSGYVDINDPAMKLATRTKELGVGIGFVRLKLKRTGTLSTATLQVQIYTDTGTVPNALVTNATSVAIPCSSIGTSAQDIGFVFSLPVYATKAKNWIVVSYADGTGVDSSNYISWAYETGANTYGERRAVYSGSWTATDAENHKFGVWDDAIDMTGDWSIIFGFLNNDPVLVTHPVLSIVDSTTNYCVYVSYDTPGITVAFYDSTARSLLYKCWPVYNVFDVYAITYSYANNIQKVKLYKNGILVMTADGTATTAVPKPGQPLALGSMVNAAGTNGNYIAMMQPFIFTNNELTAQQVGDITKNLLSLRYYRQTKL